ncbi:MAG: response regulator [Chloroflexi bacterium]|nr:response regulator [Chloroflexota bacterium]
MTEPYLEALQPEQSRARQPLVLPAEMPEKAVLLCVTEDVSSARTGLVSALKRAGFEVDLVEVNLHKPLDLQVKPYRAVVVDVNKSDGAGCELIRRIREQSAMPIMLVLHGMARNDVLLGFQAGVDAYMLAPFDEREFQARMRGLLQRTPIRPLIV